MEETTQKEEIVELEFSEETLTQPIPSTLITCEGDIMEKLAKEYGIRTTHQQQ